ncbi:hypothetical protein DXG03_007030 [Asterophora parasitica]|uniref:Integral membrane protein n=1 Tax=Asterophora parasitica TaxID=117018 RepID=A0A9P7KDG7_9AGAR|nr:hypothetical protein DXG03_007030 [Asterophora parasitica]
MRPWVHSEPVQFALRTYALSLSLSLGPSLVPFLTALLKRKLSHKTGIKAFLRVLRREFGFDGFAFAMTLSVAGGAALGSLWDALNAAPKEYTDSQSLLDRLRAQFLILKVTAQSEDILEKPFATNALLVDEPLNRENLKGKRELAKTLMSRVDALVFWACSARIMWYFFYEPQRLPKSYVKWIATLANLDDRVVQTLRHLREGKWSYTKDSASHSNVLQEFSMELGHNASWGDPVALPAYGGAVADAAWKTLGVKNRPGVGGLPCELVHGTVGSSVGLEGSCTANYSIRGTMAFLEAIAIYLPVHFFPVLLTRPQTLLDLRKVLTTLFGAIRSATFLSAFVTLYWSSVCTTRSLVFARLFPGISHDFWDGPFGCIFAGSLLCGSSIWIENGRRRGEMALYVLPRAVRACLPDAWVRNGRGKARIAERLVFILSFSTLITAAVHRPETLRGLSRWTLSFVTKGPNAGFWKQKRRSESTPDTPTITPPTPKRGK